MVGMRGDFRVPFEDDTKEEYESVFNNFIICRDGCHDVGYGNRDDYKRQRGLENKRNCIILCAFLHL
ncbi:unnamed protein product [Victoria cruziana]